MEKAERATAEDGPGADPPGTAKGPAGRECARGGWAELLRNRRFLLLEATGACASAGYAVYSVSVLFLAYGLSGDLAIAGLVLFVEYGVYTLTFLVAPIVDRVRDKRSVLLACLPTMAACAVALALALRAGVLSVPLLLGLVLALAVLWDFVWAVLMIAPRLVVERRRLFVADGLASVLSVGSRIGGYAGGGALLFFVGPYGGASAYAVLLLAALVAAVPLSLPVGRPPRTPLTESFRAGWAEFRGEAGRALRPFAGVETVVGFFAAVPPLLVTGIAYARFADPTAAYALLVTVYALGGSVAGVLVGHLNPRRSVGRLLVLMPVVAGALLLLLAPFSLPIGLAAGLLGGVGAALSVRYTAKYAWVQASYPPEILGRLTANLYLFTGAAGSFAVLLVGSLSARLPLVTLADTTGVGLLAGGGLALVLPAVRRMAF